MRRVRGMVEGLDGNTLVVKSREGDTLRTQLAPEYKVAAVVSANLSAAKPGTFIAAAAAAAAGPKDHMRALEVAIFPEVMRGTGEGHYAWDLTPESTTTNATTESEVSASGVRELTLVTKGEKLKISVPLDAPVVTFEPGTPAMLVPDAKVFVGAQASADGSLTAGGVAVGKDGLTPPM